jgi:hypothetical protein
MQKKIGFVKKIFIDLRHQRNEIFFIALIGICSVLIGKLILIPHELPAPLLWVAFFCVLGLTVRIIYRSSFVKWPSHKKISSSTKFQFAILSIAAIVGIDLMGAIAHHLIEEVMPSIGLAWTVVVILLVFVLSFLIMENLKKQSKYISIDSGSNKEFKDFGLIVTLSLPRGETKGFSKALIHGMGKRSLQQICSSIREVKKTIDTQEKRMLCALSPNAKLQISANIIGEELASLPVGNTAMFILALEWLISKATNTRRLHIIASKNFANAVAPDGSEEFIDDAKHIASHFGLSAESSVISFDNPSDIYREVVGILAQDAWYRRPAAVDLTGGNKQATFAGGVATVHESNCAVLYVDTNTLDVKLWDPRAEDGVLVPDELE